MARAEVNLTTGLDRDISAGNWAQLYDALHNHGIRLEPTRNEASYAYALNIDSDLFFTGEAAKKSYMVQFTGDRTADYAATGDSHDGLLKMSFTNRALNDTNFKFFGINASISNRSSGTLQALIGYTNTVRQRNDAGAITNLHGIETYTITNVGCGLVSGEVVGHLVEQQLESNMPTNSYAFLAKNRTDGVYTLPRAAFGAWNNGTSGCKGYEYGLDLYGNGTNVPINTADLRLSSGATVSSSSAVPTRTAVQGSLHIRTGQAANASLYINTDGATTWTLLNALV